MFPNLRKFYYCIILNCPCQQLWLLPISILLLPSAAMPVWSNPLPSSALNTLQPSSRLFQCDLQKHRNIKWIYGSGLLTLHEEMRSSCYCSINTGQVSSRSSRSQSATAKPRHLPGQGGCTQQSSNEECGRANTGRDAKSLFQFWIGENTTSTAQRLTVQSAQGEVMLAQRRHRLRSSPVGTSRGSSASKYEHWPVWLKFLI